MDFWREGQVHLEQLMPMIQDQLAAGKTVKFAPRGTSMLPMLRQGRDSVILAPLPERLKKYDLPLYRRENGQYVLHRIVKAGETYTCMGDNQFMPEHGVMREQMVGLVVAFCRDEKRVPVASWSHHVYCRAWHWSRPARYLLRGLLGRLRKILKR